MDKQSLQRIRASSVIAIGLAIHFFGYECSRAASIALLASHGTESLPYTVALGSPASALVLFLYARSIRLHGARYTLRVSEISCFVIFLFIIRFRNTSAEFYQKFLVIFFYCFREIYVSLLSTQYWSFIASILDKNTCNYLVSFTAVVSIASAIGGYCVQLLVSVWGVKGLLITTIICLALSSLTAELATIMIHQPSSPILVTTSSKSKPNMNNWNVWKDSFELMKKYRILQLLYIEAIAHQSCSNMLNMMFHEMLRRNITESSERAVVVGHFFATVNATACGLQLFILPLIISQRTLPVLLLSIPLLITLFIVIAYFQSSSITIMLAFGTLKVLEYSVMSAATEMMYMPFNEDVRYLGKELVKFFGGKLGKSGSSLTLSALNAHFQPSLGMQSLWAGVLSVSWVMTMQYLCGYLHKQQEALHKKDDDLDVVPVNERRMSNTTSESRLSEAGDDVGFDGFDDEDAEQFPLDDITPPEGWVSSYNEPLNDTEDTTRRISFDLPSLRRIHSNANLSDVASTANSGAEEKRNYFLRIGSTHASLHALGDMEGTESNAAEIFEKTGFYW